MPSARIKTRAVEDAVPLAQDLRTRGFVVQIVSLEQSANEPVDLEVTLEECEPETALRRADATPDADELHVFVAPGALTEGYRPIKVVPLVPEVSEPIQPVAQAETQKIEGPASPKETTELETTVVGLPASIPPEAVFSTPAVISMPALPQPVARVATETPKVQEIPILSPEVWGSRVETEPVASKPSQKVFYHEAVKQISSWFEKARADERMILNTAMAVAVGSVITLSVLVLGATSHRDAPMPTAVDAPTEATVQGSARMVPVVTKQRPKPAVAPVHVSEQKRRAHNPEEDIVAKDFVIRYRQRPTPLTAKKSSGVKHYSDMQ